MEWIYSAIETLLHFDQYLLVFLRDYGMMLYILLFLIIFCETGLIIFPFLPGDSLLFILGTLCAQELLDLRLILISLSIAAILGDSVNFHLGYYANRPLIRLLKKLKIFNQKSYDLAQKFYNEHGALAIITARFIPLLRTFVPFVAGVAKMNRKTFIFNNVVGGLLWIWGITLFGYLLGSLPIPWLQEQSNLRYIFLLLILIPGLIAIVGFLRFYYQKR